MFSFALRRPRFAEWRDRLPPLALALAMFAILIALGGDRGYFYRSGGIHDFNTAQTLTIAENLSPEHNFRLAYRIFPNEDGGFEYHFYGRFPVGGFALTKLAIAPFGDDLAAKLAAARVLALAMFCGAALFAYLAIARIAGGRLVALAAVPLAFSGFYAIYYADAVFNEGAMDMFGAAMVFHGMAVFAQEGRFRQLLLKTCAALFLGWHVYALLLPFIAFGFGGEAVALIRSALSSGDRARAARSAAVALIRSRYAVLAAVAVLFGGALLALNVLNERATYGDERSLSELPIFDAALRRLGQTDDYIRDPELAWGNFFRRQFFRAGAAVVPYSVARAVGYDVRMPEPSRDLALAPTILGIAAACAALGALALVRRRRDRALAASAILFGFCWAIPFRYNTFHYGHPFEGLWYVALALALFALALAGARRLLGERAGRGLAIAAAAIAAPLFALSVFQAGQLDRDADRAELNKGLMADFSAIREIARGKSVGYVSYYHEPAWNRVPSWLYWKYPTGYYIGDGYAGNAPICDWEGTDYVVSRERHENLNTLTPGNRFAFLYAEPLEVCREKRRALESSPPSARSAFDVYLREDSLGYLKAPCAPSDYAAPFFAYMYAANSDDLPPEHRRNGFQPLNEIRFEERGEAFDDACLMTLRLPDYPIASVRTGQYAANGGRLWEASIAPPPSADTLAGYEAAYREIASGEPAARAEFDIYLNGDSLAYLKTPCAESDAGRRFFLSVHPAYVGDLPPERRAIGHESLNFDFDPPLGVAFGGKCMAARRLPDYPIAEIRTGQSALAGEGAWEASITPPPPSADAAARYEAAYRETASAQPIARTEFDIYLSDGALTYLKAPCSDSDARGRFLLSVYPADESDLPPERREIGHESLNFDFAPPTAVFFGGKCMATRQLPNYEIAKIETGKWIPGGESLWEVEIAVGE